MSGGGRGERDSHLDQGFAVLSAIGLCCLVVGILSFSWGRDSERDSQRAANYQDYRERRENAFCADISSSLLAKCQIEQEQAAREAYQAERDLEAQRDMSLWALAVFVISFVTAGLTLWALWYVRGTLKATLDAVEDTSEATQEMKGANRIAAAQLRYSYKPLLRPTMEGPYIDVSQTPLTTVNDPTDREIRIWSRPYIENIGERPAEILDSFVFFAGSALPIFGHNIHNEIRQILKPGQRLRIFPNGKESDRRIYQMNETEGFSLQECPTAQFQASQAVRHQLKHDPSPIGYRITYSDPLGNIYEMGACFAPSASWDGEPYKPVGGNALNYDRLIRRTADI